MALQPKPFTLDVVLNYRKLLEDQAKNRFFEAQKIRDLVELKLQEETSALQDLVNEVAQLQADGIEITRLILFEEKINSSRKNLAAIKKNLQEKEKLVHQAQQTLLQKSQEYQVMERLKNEQNSAWQNHLNKKEAAMLDEVAIMRHGKDPFDSE